MNILTSGGHLYKMDSKIITFNSKKRLDKKKIPSSKRFVILLLNLAYPNNTSPLLAMTSLYQ